MENIHKCCLLGTLRAGSSLATCFSLHSSNRNTAAFMLITKSCFKCATQPCLQPEGPCRFNELTCQQRSVHPPEKCSYSWGELWSLFSTAGGPRVLCQVESTWNSSGFSWGSRGWVKVLGVKSSAMLGLHTCSSVTEQWSKLETHTHRDRENMLLLLVWKVGHIQHCKWEADSRLTQRTGLFLRCHCNFFECREVHPPTDYFTRGCFCALWLMCT